MTPEQLDHLRRIDAHLANLLDIAAKRTPGEWTWNAKYGGSAEILEPRIWLGESSILPAKEPHRNAAYIASCAGNAEAGWRATRAAIALLLSMGEHQHDIETAKAGFDALESILAAFPNI